MSELLLELLSEEIPARMQLRASEDLKRLVVEGLKTRGLETGAATAYSTPRRLTLVVEGVPAKSPAISDEKKGPRVGAPEQAVQGFLKSAGLASIKNATDRQGREEGRLLRRQDREARPRRRRNHRRNGHRGGGQIPVAEVDALGLVAVSVGAPAAIGAVPARRQGRAVRDRGLQAAPKPVAIASSDPDRSRSRISPTTKAKLAAHHVMLDPAARVAAISEQAHALAKEAKLELIEDEALLSENAGLTEWPVVLMGTFDKAFLEVPGRSSDDVDEDAPEMLFAARAEGEEARQQVPARRESRRRGRRRRDHRGQRKGDCRAAVGCQVLLGSGPEASARRNGGQASGITFHEKLGTQKDRVERIAELAFELAGACDADPQDARRAAALAKADLVSGMVGEFPELQGLMGRYYAEHVGAKPEIARAIELHYKPKGPTDVVPHADQGDAVAVAVALADKLDTLVGFWAIDEKPTGSGDPYQLRRAALGVIRIVLENDLRVPLAANNREIKYAYSAGSLQLEAAWGSDLARVMRSHQERV